MKIITDHEIIVHGLMNSQYFQGCGVAFTRFDDVATGIGESPAEALEDALEQLAMSDWETVSIKSTLSSASEITEDMEDCYYYVSVRVTDKE